MTLEFEILSKIFQSLSFSVLRLAWSKVLDVWNNSAPSLFHCLISLYILPRSGSALLSSEPPQPQAPPKHLSPSSFSCFSPEVHSSLRGLLRHLKAFSPEGESFMPTLSTRKLPCLSLSSRHIKDMRITWKSTCGKH